MNRKIRRRGAKYGLVGSAAVMIGMSVAGGSAHADATQDKWGFTPISTGALGCSTTGDPAWAAPLVGAKLMSAGDVATLVGGGATTIGRENDMIALSADGTYLFSSSENGAPSDGISRYTLTGPGAGTKEILTPGPAVPATPFTNPSWSRMDGLYWYAPSGMLLGGEEYSITAANTANTQARGGGVWQINPTTGAYVRLDWLGSLAHEGIVFAGGALYFGDEQRNAGFFKAVPTDVNDLTKGGTLYFLAGSGIDASGWKQVTNPDNAANEAINLGGILFDRPEDVDARNGRVYFTVTEPQGDADTRKGNYNGTATGGVDVTKNQVVNRGGVYSLNTAGFPDLATQSGAQPPYTKIAPMIEVQDPTYANQAAAQAQQGLQFPDNMAFDGRGHLWLHEDIPDSTTSTFTSGIDTSKQVRNQQDELYVYELDGTGTAIVDAGTTSKGVKAADMRSSDPTAALACTNEFTGGIFASNGLDLFINQQHNANPTFKLSLTDPLPAQVPEAPVTALLSLGAAGLLGGAFALNRRKAARA